MSIPPSSTPPPLTPVRDFVFERLRAAFGEPHRIVGTDRHWALRPVEYAAAIHVLCNGKDDFPILWVFNPHDAKDGVRHTVIRETTEVDALVAGIQEEVRHAGRPR